MKGKTIPRWLLRTVIAIFVVVVVLVLVSLFLWQSKKNTCRGIGDVWADVGILVSQHNNKEVDIRHNLSSLGVYLTSNTLDGVLYECRTLLRSDAVLDKIISMGIYSTAGSRALRPDRTSDGHFAREEVLLLLNSEKTQWRETPNPNTMAYTKDVNMIDLCGWVIHPQGDRDTMVGYISEMTISASETEAGADSVLTKTVYQANYVDDFNHANQWNGDISSDSLAGLLEGQGTYFDFSVSQLQLRFPV